MNGIRVRYRHGNCCSVSFYANLKAIRYGSISSAKYEVARIWRNQQTPFMEKIIMFLNANIFRTFPRSTLTPAKKKIRFWIRLNWVKSSEMRSSREISALQITGRFRTPRSGVSIFAGKSRRCLFFFLFIYVVLAASLRRARSCLSFSRWDTASLGRLRSRSRTQPALIYLVQVLFFVDRQTRDFFSWLTRGRTDCRLWMFKKIHKLSISCNLVNSMMEKILKILSFQ